MNPDLSVIICTHNPCPVYLRRALESLRSQSLDPSNWELLLIDNYSEQPVEGRFDVSWHPNAKIIVERQLGLTPARLRGIRESCGETLCFVDDDNLLESDYLCVLQRLMAEHPRIGALGPGRVIPEFEKQPDPSLNPLLPSLVIRELDVPVWSNVFGDHAVPYGAGMAVRRVVASEYLDFSEANTDALNLDRNGKNLMGGGDVLFSFIAVKMGLAKGLFPDLRLRHLISAPRVDKCYLLRLAYSNGKSEALLEKITDHSFGYPGLAWRLLDYLQKIRRGNWTVARARMLQFKGYRDKRRELST